jgi:hypothetical protein
VPGTPLRTTPRPQSIRNPSSNTASGYTTRTLGGSRGSARTIDSQRRRLSSLPISTTANEVEPDPPSPGPADTSSGPSSDDESSPAQSRIIRRPPRFQNHYDVASSFADDDEEDEPAFLPYRPPNEGSGSGPHDLSATLRGTLPRKAPKQHGKIHLSQTSDSSTSSAALGPRGQGSGKSGLNNPLSPRRTMELAGRSPSGKGKGYSRDSDGTPSMGSSFSDLDGMSYFYSTFHALGYRVLIAQQMRL